MHIIARPAIVAAKRRYPTAASWLDDWWAAASKAAWSRLADVRVLYPLTDEVGQCLVFNACGNDYRLICRMTYANPWTDGTLLVKHFLTHGDYDKKKMVQGLHSAGKGREEMSTATEYRQLLTEYAPQPIRSQKAYEQALAQLERLMVPRPNAARSLLIEVLATLIEKYEAREYPTPEVAPAEMLAKLLKTKGVRPADVARTTGIPTATLSNVLARRRGISKQNAFKLGEYFGLSPIVFLGGPSQKKAAVR